MTSSKYITIFRDKIPLLNSVIPMPYTVMPYV